LRVVMSRLGAPTWRLAGYALRGLKLSLLKSFAIVTLPCIVAR
jgi:hypothetical protein